MNTSGLTSPRNGAPPILGQDTESSSDSREIKVRGIPFTALASTPSISTQSTLRCLPRLLGFLKPVGSICSLVKGQQLPLPSAELPEPTDLPSHPAAAAKPGQRCAQIDNAALLQHLFEQDFGKAQASPSGFLIAPIRGVCQANLTGYWFSVYTRHSAVGVLSKHWIFMSDISKFRSHSPTAHCLGLYINQCLESLSL